MSRPLNKEVKELAAALNSLNMPDIQKEALQARYIAYVDWLERAATGSRRGHYLMRLIAAVGGVIVTSMSSAEVLGDPPDAVRWILLGTSLAVGIALALDGFLNLGERWRHYRRAAETLKSQGWRLVQRTDPYSNLSDTDAARAFAGRVEDLIGEETSGYVRGPARPAAAPPAAP